VIAAITVFVAAAQAKDQLQLTVEVLKAETVHWTTYLHDDGSAGKTTTDCDIYDTNASCTSTTQTLVIQANRHALRQVSGTHFPDCGLKLIQP
jgi:hypothetical protein